MTTLGGPHSDPKPLSVETNVPRRPTPETSSSSIRKMTTPVTEPPLTQDDAKLMLAEVARFCQRSIRPIAERSRLERPAHTLTTDELARLTRQATEIGLVNLSDAPAFGLWENIDNGHGVPFSIRALRRVAQENAGVAFHFHQLALGAFLRRSLGVDTDAKAIACIQGVFGLARHSLARLLKGRKLQPDDVEMLRDYFVTLDAPSSPTGQDGSVPLLFQAADDWQQLLVPCFSATQSLHWAVFDREDIMLKGHIERLEHSHGLDETFTWQWRRHGESPRQTFTDQETSLTLYNKVLNINAQALVAIALGTLQHGYDKAVEYAALRIQGGKLIDQHAAVQKMLANCSSTIHTVESLQQSTAALDVNAESLAVVLSVRAQAHNLLCDAANDALQVFGGIGYVRQTGLEKIVRDNNHLRQLSGTPDELLLFLVEWEKG